MKTLFGALALLLMMLHATPAQAQDEPTARPERSRAALRLEDGMTDFRRGLRSHRVWGATAGASAALAVAAGYVYAADANPEDRDMWASIAVVGSLTAAFSMPIAILGHGTAMQGASTIMGPRRTHGLAAGVAGLMMMGAGGSMMIFSLENMRVGAFIMGAGTALALIGPAIAQATWKGKLKSKGLEVRVSAGPTGAQFAMTF